MVVRGTLNDEGSSSRLVELVSTSPPPIFTAWLTTKLWDESGHRGPLN